jgi:CheY-like chemotaxis protein
MFLPIPGNEDSAGRSEVSAGLPRPVLIVDDDPDDIFLIRRLVEGTGTPRPVMTFKESADALEFLRSFTELPPSTALKPAVMFLDIKMPGVHGFVLLKWVRQQSALDDMHVLMLSGSDEPSDRMRAEKLGADGYLVKFPPVEKMAEAIAAAEAVSRAR